jgi:ABA DEFICIENT 4-like
MNMELFFSLAGMLAMSGWITLLASPFSPLWSDRIAGVLIPLILSVGYVTLLIFFPSEGGGGFGSLAEVTELFSNPNAVFAGWVHYLAFDLLVGAWICRTAREESVKFWMIIPCLPLTFLFGPAGFLAFSLVRLFGQAKASST